jgi:16S rRNA (guanine1516-N2)-methyltransferase
MTYFLSLSHEGLREQANPLVQKYHFQINEKVLPRLHLSDEGLMLLDFQGKAIGLDWSNKHWKQRAKGALGRDPIIKATLAGQKNKILDLTAGWGKDALLMAQAGATIVLVEQHAYMAALLDENHRRLIDLSLKSRITVIWSNASDYLHQLSPEDYPDVIYLDPMHPKRNKCAQVKKHLHLLQEFIPPNNDVLELIEMAKDKCRIRVVLKWPAKKTPPAKADFSLQGKTIL